MAAPPKCPVCGKPTEEECRCKDLMSFLGDFRQARPVASYAPEPTVAKMPVAASVPPASPVGGHTAQFVPGPAEPPFQAGATQSDESWKMYNGGPLKSDAKPPRPTQAPGPNTSHYLAGPTEDDGEAHRMAAPEVPSIPRYGPPPTANQRWSELPTSGRNSPSRRSGPRTVRNAILAAVGVVGLLVVAAIGIGVVTGFWPARTGHSSPDPK